MIRKAIYTLMIFIVLRLYKDKSFEQDTFVYKKYLRL